VSAHERQRLSAFHDGELSPSDQAAVTAHLATCPECRAWLDEIEAVDEAARHLSVETPAGYFEALPARLRARIEDEHAARGGADGRDGHRWTGTGAATGGRSSTRRRAGGPWPAWTWAVAAALLLAVVTPLTLRQAPGEKSPGAPPAPERAVRQSRPAADPPSEDLASSDVDDAPRPEDREGGSALGRVAPRASAGREEYRRPSAPGSPRAPGAGSGDEAAAPAATAPSSGERTATRHEAEEEAFARPPPGAAPAAPGPAAAEADRVAPRTQARKGALEGGEAERAKATLADAPPDASPSEQAAPLREELSAAAEPRSEAQAVSGLEAGAGAGPDEVAYRRLARDRPTDADGWRRQREAWRAFAERYPASPHADEARVRTIEAGVAAWRAGGRKADLDRAREDLARYLDRADAWLGERARRALEGAPEP